MLLGPRLQFPNQRGSGRMKKDGYRKEMLMLFDLERVKANVRTATTEDLLDRVTVYRAGMEESALDVIEDELRTRNIRSGDIQAHAERRRLETQILPDGTAVPCSFCHRPAVAEGWGWHRLWGLLPLFPRFYHYCSEHRPDSQHGQPGVSDMAEEPVKSQDDPRPPG
jgi:hypothetical protein